MQRHVCWRQLPGAGAVVHTIDLPEEAIQDPECRDQIGDEFLSRPVQGAEIVLHRGDTRRFDFSRFEGQVDLVFVDGSHAFSDVLADSAAALRMLQPEGVVLWHDYHISVPGVVRALNKLGRGLSVVRIEHTRLVVHQRGGSRLESIRID